MTKWLFLLTIWIKGSALSNQKISAMCLPASNSTLKILDQTLCPIFAISKCSVRPIFRKNPQLNCSEISFIWTVAQNSQTDPTLSLVGWQFKRGEMSISPTPSFIVTPRTGITLGFIAKTHLQLAKILYRVTALTVLAILIRSLRGWLPRNGPTMHHNSQNSEPLWQTV